LPDTDSARGGEFDAVVVGGGHNGLTAAAYLARAGLRVLVLERLDAVGGAAVSHRAFEGHEARLSRYAYLVSLLPQQIARDLGVHVELRTRSVAAYAPGPDGGLLVDDPADSARTAASFRALTGSARDHASWLDFYAMTSAFAQRVFPTVLEPLPARADVERLVADVPGAWEALVERPLGETLAQRFGDGLVRGVVSTDGLIGTFARVDEPSLRQNRCFLYHVVGGGDGRWRVPVGGMGALTAGLARAAADAGAALRTSAEVIGIEHAGERSEVTWQENGAEHVARTRFVLSNVAPGVLARLAGEPAPDPAPDAEGAQTKLNMLLDRLPRLRSGVPAEEAFAGTFRLNENESDLAAAYAEAASGELPARPPAELYCHSLTDRSILGPGAPLEQNTLTLFGLHTPARLFRPDNDGARATMTERYLDALDEHLEEPIRDCFARDARGRPCVEAKTPLDLERELGLPAGNIFHGDLSWPWAEGEGGGWGVETDHPRTFVCGAGAVRGGGVSGIGGHNAAMAVLERLG
jgi:phytoene dehydrogenase-like protein